MQAAWQKNLETYEIKWSEFKRKVLNDDISNTVLKKMTSTLDNDREWAALHYAVEFNNMKLCSILTSENEPYRCGTSFFSNTTDNMDYFNKYCYRRQYSWWQR